jgi:c-di-GMP-binding flagellar brake protein YcgR
MADSTETNRSKNEQGVLVAFKPGKAILVQAPAERQRYWGRVIGVEVFEYFIVKLPTVPGITRLTATGALLTMRLEHEGELYGFTCEVLASITRPHPMVIASYPKSSERLKLRKHKRVKCLIPCLVENDFFKSPGFIVDMSRGGCQLVLDMFQPERAVNLMKGDDVRLQTSLDSVSNLTCQAKVVSSSEISQGRFLGVSFDSDAAEGKKALGEFMDRLEAIDAIIEERA